MRDELNNPDSEFLWVPGTAALLCGVGLVVVGLLDGAGLVSFRLPRFWYLNRPLWWLFGVALIVVGGRVIACSRRTEREVFQSVVLYTRDGCHLCEDARGILERWSHRLPDLQVVDIDAEPELAAQFNTCVPVVEIDGRIRFRGNVNEVLLKRLIRAAEVTRADS